MGKQSASRLLDETFNKDFEINRFIKFVKELFNNFTVSQKECTKYIASQYKEYIASFDKIGDYENTRKAIEVLVVQLNKTSSRDRARTMQRNFIANWLDKTQKDAALVAFYGDDPQDWRFSFVKMEYRLAEVEPGKVKAVKELTPAKRYSFLVGVNEPNHTCRRQFLELVQQEDVNPTLEEIEKTFSIDNVTKEFFLNYKELYLGLEESLEEVIDKDPYVKREFEEKNISTIDFAKKLLGQIVFIYFLQKKGWLGVGKDETGRFKPWGTGPKNFLRKLFDKEIVPYDNFFNDILEPLFYEALADDRTANHDYYSRFNCKIPFLNGGLFEPINDYDWAGTEIVLDNSVFEKILTTFDRFNFTVKEDEPLEKEVAIDPEMLGKVFENLLEIKDRKSTGRYYTPREIVHYMCQQSMINYLETNTSIPRDDIEKFIQLGDFALDLTIRAQEQKKRYHGKTFDIDESLAIPKPIEDNYKEIDRLLKEIKIVDPAVGSGAFPIGMMNEIVKARSILSIFFDEDEQRKRTVYKFKRKTIENSLYGVDIDSSAGDIAKLRFWLSLIVDEEDIKNIKPLPNLDHKIMCGNSLLEEFEGVKLFDEKLLIEIPKDYSYQLEQIDREVNKLNQELHGIHTGKKADNGTRTKQIQRDLKNLKRNKQEILSGSNEDVPQLTLDEAFQKRMRESQKKLKELKDLQKKFFNEQNRKLKKQYREDIERIEWELIEETLKEEGNEEAMQKLEQCKKKNSKPFFLWKLYFSEVFQRENPGFDVVIANPPYVDSENMVKNMPKEREDIASCYVTAKGNWDLYIPFYELAFNISRERGILTFIAPNKWLSISYGKKLREFFNDYLIQICNCDEIDVFEAGNTPEITFIKKEISSKNANIHSFSSDYLIRKRGDLPRSILEKGNWGMLLSRHIKLLTKIFNQQDRLIQFCDVENPFTVSEAYELVNCLYDGKNKNEKGGFKLINTGTIDKYLSLWGNKTTSYIKKKYKFPFINKNTFQELMPNRFQQSNSKKIIIAGIRYFECFFDSLGEYVAGKSTIIIRNPRDGVTFDSLLAILNSKLINFYLRESYSATGIDGGVNFTTKMIENIPFPKVSGNEMNFKKLSNSIIQITKDDDYLDNPDKQSKVKKLEKEIDELVYELYELTPEEIEIVEAFNKEK